MKPTICILLLLSIQFYDFTQSVTIDPKANITPILDTKSTNEGIVLPKMTVATTLKILEQRFAECSDFFRTQILFGISQFYQKL